MSNDEENKGTHSVGEEEEEDTWIGGCEPAQNIDTKLAEFEGPNYSTNFTVKKTWDSKEELYEWVKAKGRELVMALIRRNSSPYQVSIVCERFGKMRSSRPQVNKENPELPITRQRKTTSKKCGCRFELMGVRGKKEPGIQNPKWILGVIEGRHNHELTWDLGGNAFMGRMTPREEEMVRSLAASRNTPKQIVRSLRTHNPENLTTRKQVANLIYNENQGELSATQKARNKEKEAMRERSPFEQALNESNELERSKAKEKGQEKSDGKASGRSRKAATSSLGVDCIQLLEAEDEPRNIDPARLAEMHLVHYNVNFGRGNIDNFWLRYMTWAQDVLPDGHCGYRSLAVLLGLHEDDYWKVKAELLAELIENKSLYEPIRQNNRPGTWDDLIRQVNYQISPCEEEYWFHWPLLGLAFATRFQVAVVLLTWYGPTMCLPLRWRFEDMGFPNTRRAVSHAGNLDHFVAVMLSDYSPLPQPPSAWRLHAAENVKWWEDHFAPRIEMYRNFRFANGRNSN